MSMDIHEYDALTRLDFWVFVQRVFAELGPEAFSNNFHIELLAARLDQLRTGSVTRLAIALPPRSLKSIIVSIALPAWLMGHNPATQIICASYGQDLADKLASDCRQVMQSAWYRRLFPQTRLAAGRQALSHYQTTEGGVRIATSVGGVLTGFGADVIIVDDPMKPDEALSETERNKANAWARHTLFTRLNDKQKGSIIIVMQRLHEDDMIGHVGSFADFELLSFPAIAQEDEHHIVPTPFGDWHHIRREGEALHPDREPLEVLEQQRRLMGTAFFAAQYLQSPTPPGGGIVKTDWFRRFDPTNKPEFDNVVQSWDTASKASELSDYSVCTTWGIVGHTPDTRKVYLIDVSRLRAEYPELKRLVIEQARKYNARKILIEDTASGIQLIQELRYQNIHQIEAIKPKGDKVLRFQAQTPAIEGGQVFLPTHASWLSAYLHELEMFPNGKFDDQVDSTAQALAHICTPNSGDNWMEFIRLDTEERQLRELLAYTGGIMPTSSLITPIQQRILYLQAAVKRSENPMARLWSPRANGPASEAQPVFIELRIRPVMERIYMVSRLLTHLAQK
jgi:predicted phage terminase large subunit-like protein